MNGREIIVKVADLQVAGAGDQLVTVGLGSCIAIVLHDRDAAAQSHGEQLVARSADLEVGDLDDDLVAVHAARR